MRIALIIERLPDTGGGFPQAISMILALARPDAMSHEVLVFTQFECTRQVLQRYGIDAIRFKHRFLNFLDFWSSTVTGAAVLGLLRGLGFPRLGRHLDAFLDDHGIDLVVFTECAGMACRLGDHAFVITVWDLYHRDHPDFPDVYSRRTFERLERVHRSTLARALAVIADSPAGARRIARLYHVDPERIVVLPFVAPAFVRRHLSSTDRTTTDAVGRKYNLPIRYVFYPAYFGALKNHLYLLEGLIDLEHRYGIVLDAVFCGGGDPADRDAVRQQVDALGLAQRVHIVGLIPDDDIPPLYSGALALVYPGYCGPTNLPPLEAVALGCPVIYSDLPEFREQMGDAALYCDLADASSLADHLATLSQDSAQSERLRAAGWQLAAEMWKINYVEILMPILENFDFLRRRYVA